MKLWALLLGAALAGRPAGGALVHVVAVAADAPAYAELPVGGGVVGLEGVGESEAMALRADPVEAVVGPGHAVLTGDGAQVLLGSVPEFSAMTAVGGMVSDGGVPSYEALVGGLRLLQLDELIGLVDPWAYGPLGMLAKQAQAALAAGDVVTFRKRAAQYWERMGAAEARRRTLVGRGTGGR